MVDYVPRLKAKYSEEIRGVLKEKFAYKNEMMIPKLQKIVLNMGVGEAVGDSKKIKSAHEDLKIIAGQLPSITKAKKSIAGFKVREEMPLGVKVTLRREKMYEFLDRFISVTAPRIRDFRGLPSKGFDGRGNYNFGITEQIVFPEIDYDNVNSIRGMNVTFVTSAETDYEAYELLVGFGFPINELTKKKK